MFKIFLDSSDLNAIRSFKDGVQGFTTNPTLMRRAGVSDYERFCRLVLEAIPDKPVSFEVFSDDFSEMERQARRISSWGSNVYVKIPITNTSGDCAIELIRNLGDIKLNITAITTVDQIRNIYHVLSPGSIVSVFAGRIADTGIDPTMSISESKIIVGEHIQVLWASPREVLNIYQARESGADIITCTPELIAKYEKFRGMDLDRLSLETVAMFYEDGRAAGYSL